MTLILRFYLLLAFVTTTTVAFLAPQQPAALTHRHVKLPASPGMDVWTSDTVSAITVDPTTFLSDIFTGVVGTPVILLVPIVAALGVAGLIVAFIVGYANPQVDDDDEE